MDELKRDVLLHDNTWKWGRSVSIVIGGGIGLCKVQVEKGEHVAWLTDISVWQPARRQGVGDRLIDEAVTAAIRMGAKKLLLWPDGEQWLLDWYHMRGFSFSGLITKDGHDVLSMKL